MLQILKTHPRQREARNEKREACNEKREARSGLLSEVRGGKREACSGLLSEARGVQRIAQRSANREAGSARRAYTASVGKLGAKHRFGTSLLAKSAQSQDTALVWLGKVTTATAAPDYF